MGDFYEVDFIYVGSPKSGDAIALHYGQNGAVRTHVVDGGFQDTGDRIIEHIRTYYGDPRTIDAVVVTHPDGDHTGGLRAVLENLDVRELWMLRPWVYADELIASFTRFQSVESLKKRLKELYPNIALLEEVAMARPIPIPIFAPLQGTRIGAFTVLAPSKERYLQLIRDSERTPEATGQAAKGAFALSAMQKVVAALKSVWGQEVFPPDGTSAENEMSVVQYARLCERTIVLTGDAGRGALAEAADFAPRVGLELPGVNRFQVPHHGSRHNVSTEILDRWLGKQLPSKPQANGVHGQALASASSEDKDHPRKAVVRGVVHRGFSVFKTNGGTVYIHENSPTRPNWSPAPELAYPEDQEE